VSIATKPDRATDGALLSENRVGGASLTDSEIQVGRWLDSSQLDPGVYYVLLQAFPDFDTCYQSGGGYDPSCADGYSDPVTVNVPVPKQTYRGTVERQTFLKRVELGFVVNPLGAKLPYRVCYLNALKTRRCLVGIVDGFDWNSRGTDSLTVTTRGLATQTPSPSATHGPRRAAARLLYGSEQSYTSSSSTLPSARDEPAARRQSGW
jgi:hypothetical protein